MENEPKRFGGVRAANLDSIAFLVLLAMVFLLPVFFLPSLSAPFQFTKTLIAVYGTLVALIALIISRLREGTITLPLNLVIAGAWGVALANVLSGLFASESLVATFIGARFEVDTVVFMVIMALLVTVTPLLTRRKEQVMQLLLVLLLSGAALALYHVARFLGGADFLSLGVFTTTTANLLGKWNDLGIFFGLVAIVAVMAIEVLPLSRLLKIFSGVLLALALLVLAVVNFLPVWIALGVFALGLFMQGFVARRSVKKSEVAEAMGLTPVAVTVASSRVAMSALIVLLIAILFALQGSSAGDYFADLFGISQVEARPSWTTTVEIAGETYRDNPIFGSGPNTFAKQWALYKPTVVNESAFWNIDFTAGIGTIPTSFVTTGALGALAWSAFLILILIAGYRGLIARPPEDRSAYQLAITTFVAAVYLLALSIVYVTNVVLVALAFLFVGLFLSTLRYSAAGLHEYRVNFADNPRLGFVSVLVLTVVLIVTLIGLYSVGQRYVSAFHFQRSVVALNIEGNTEDARQQLDRAVALAQDDSYYRFAVQVGLAELNNVIADTERSETERRDTFQQTLATTIRNALRATEIDPGNYQNWVALGDVYRAVVPLGIEGSYQSAVDAYDRARALAPQNPSIPLSLAQLEVVNGNGNEARAHIEAALALKSNYTAAIFLLAQLQVQAGEVQNAIRSVEATTLLVPNNPVLFFQLGILRFNVGDNAGAAAALERAVELNDTYANARYFLGLTYHRLGRIDVAIAEFEQVQAFNPENAEVVAILANLRAGADPFEGLATSEDIVEREELPVEEQPPAEAQ